jgi:creatinine amidohydrolase
MIRLNDKARSLSSFTYLELERYLGEETLCILPLGAMEQHGPHLPLGTDSEIANIGIDELCSSWTDALQLLVLPVMPIGESMEHSTFTGTLSFSVSTLQAVITDIAVSLGNWGVKKLLIINFHGGNSDTVSSILREVRQKTGVLCGAAHVYGSDVLQGYGGARDYHAGDIETSIVLHYLPEAVRREAVPEKASADGKLKKMELFKNLVIPWFTGDLSADGIIGNPRDASAQKGKAIISDLVKELKEIIRRFAAYEE